KVFAGFRHFRDALDLPGDLVDVVLRSEVLGVLTCVLAFVEFLLVEQCEGVMIPGVSTEKPCTGRFGDEEAEQIKIEAPADLQVRRIETEVAESANLERAVQSNAADVVFDRFRCCHASLSSGTNPSFYRDTLTLSMSALQPGIRCKSSSGAERPL